MQRNKWSLQLFAEGSAAAGEGQAPAAGEQNQQAEVAARQTAEPEAAPQEPSLDEEYNELIKGKFKAQHDNAVQKIINKRFKETKQMEEQLKSLAPISEALGAKYGVDPHDTAALVKAVEDDESYYADAAYEQGVSVEQYKALLDGQRARQELEEQRQQERMRTIVADLHRQAEEVQQKYDRSFDFQAAYAGDEGFRTMINAGVPVETAYKVLNFDRAVGTAAQRAKQEAARQIQNDIVANGQRPRESAAKGGQTAAPSPINIRGLTDAQMDELERRAAAGEVITLRQ